MDFYPSNMRTEWIVVAALAMVALVGVSYWLGTQNASINEPGDLPNTPGRGPGTTIPPRNDIPQSVPPVIETEEFPPLPEGITYDYGAKFEPPAGRVVHGIGQWDEYNEKYLALLNQSNYPASELIFIQIGESDRPWAPAKLKAQVFKVGNAGEIPSMNITLSGNQPTQAELDKLPDPLFGIDDEVVNSTKYDSRIQP